jgi:hypothetical protein
LPLTLWRGSSGEVRHGGGGSRARLTPSSDLHPRAEGGVLELLPKSGLQVLPSAAWSSSPGATSTFLPVVT